MLCTPARLLLTGADFTPAQEDAEPPAPSTRTYLPGTKLGVDEQLMPDESVYIARHTLSYAWPCLSFDILADNLGTDRSTYPQTAWIVAGTQAGEVPGQGKAKDEVVVMSLRGLSKTQQLDSDDEGDDDDDEDGADEDATLDFLTIPHVGSVNRIRARTPKQAGAAVPDPYHVATFSETGKVHIFDVRPYIDTLSGPSKPRQKSPIHTVHNHGRAEGFAVEWGETGLLTGDVDSKIFLTTATESGFTTADKPYLSHTSSVEDLQWSPSESTVFASCSADRTVRVWDVRAKQRKSVVSVQAHDEDVNVISWNKGVEYLLLSGGDEGGLKVWDLRMFKECVLLSFPPDSKLICIAHPHLSLTSHGTLHPLLPSSGTLPTRRCSPRPVQMTRSRYGTFRWSRTRTRRRQCRMATGPRTGKHLSTCRRSCYSSIRARRT